MTKVVLGTVGSERIQRKLTAPILCRLRSIVALTPYEEHVIEALQLSSQVFDAGTQVYAEGDPVVRPWIVGAGWACRLRALSDGRIQILGFFLPGDSIGLNEVSHPAVQPTILALTDLSLLNADKIAEATNRGDEKLANIVRACRIESISRQARLLDHAVRLGRLTALERMAHLLLELDHRMQCAGLANGGRFPLPLTQSQIGDALGLSLVHVNRTMQQLRREQLIELETGQVALLNRERLELLCDYRKPAI